MLKSLWSRPISVLALVLGAAAHAQTPTKADPPAKPDEKPVPEAKVSITQHRVRLGEATLAYSATAGTMLMQNEKEEPIALFGFTAYVKEGGDLRTRPIVFAYNGGPGSASVWLHMGILGPKRTVLTDVDANTRGPFRYVDNEFSILDEADLVLLDPVGTGFSRAVGKAEGKDFWGVDPDIESVSAFIVRYITEYGRWASPKFVLGESYGGIRTGGVSYHLLTKHSVALNGVILVSPYMDFVAGSAGLKMDLPYVNYLSTFAATAWYHAVLEPRSPELRPFLKEVEKFAHEVYAPVLMKGHRASAAERQAVLAGLARYTGLSTDYWDRANLRIDEDRFAQELMRKLKATTGRIDSRFKGGSINLLAESFKYDPFMTSIGPAVVATFNDYYRTELKVESDRSYVVSGGLYRDWDKSHKQPDLDGSKVPFANTAVDLAHALTQNPKMRVLVQQGYFDLATPYGATDYFIDHLDVAESLRSNVRIEYYEAGHMMYVHPPSMAKFKRDLAEFVRANSR